MTKPEPIRPADRDPYAPPPRYKESSGKLVRVLILAGVLGVVGAGYALYADDIQQAANEPMVQEEQQFAEAPPLPPVDSQAATPESTTTNPAPNSGPAPSPAQTAPTSAPVTDAPLPPPSTTTDPSGE